jgi:hypothetical protein
MNMGTTYRYARVSTDGQTLSGRRRIVSPSSKARSPGSQGLPRDLLKVLATISELEAGFRSLCDQWAVATTPGA